MARLTRVAVTRWELEAGWCGVAMPVFGPGGEVVAALELSVRDLGTDLKTVMGPLAIAARSLSRELCGSARYPAIEEKAEQPAPLAVGS